MSITDRYLPEPEVLRIAGKSAMTIRRWEREGWFPRRVRLGPNSVAWLESEVLQWLRDRADARTAAAD